MKKLAYILGLFILTQGAVSCNRMEDGVFENSSAQRINEAIEKYNQILNDAPFGWELDFYAGDSINPDGGYRMLMDFNLGKVTMASELDMPNAAAGEKIVSSYTFKTDKGPVLSIDSYNDVLHPWAADGREADFEFVMEQVSASQIILRGKKFGNRMVMRPLKEEVDWKQYMQEVNDLQVHLLTKLRFKAEKSGEDLGFVNLDAFKFNETENSDLTPVLFTVGNKGISLQKPYRLGGIDVEQFVFDPATESFTAVENSAIKLKNVTMKYEDFFGTYKLSYSSNKGNQEEIVTIASNEKDKTLKMTSKVFMGDAILEYRDGDLILAPQSLGPVNAGSANNRWIATRFDVSIFGLGMSVNYQIDNKFIMGSKWVQGDPTKARLEIVSKYTHSTLLGTVPMYGVALMEYNGTAKVKEAPNQDGVVQIYNMVLTKQ